MGSLIESTEGPAEDPSGDPSGDLLSHHIHMALWTDRSREDIATRFAKMGWSSRKCTWIDYEVTLEDQAELVIESENPILVHGPIASAGDIVPTIRKILDDADIVYAFETYDEQNELLIEVTLDGSPPTAG